MSLYKDIPFPKTDSDPIVRLLQSGIRASFWSWGEGVAGSLLSLRVDWLYV